MPDQFVPLDTTRYTKLHRELSAKSYIIETNLHYLDKNRKQLQKKYKTFEQFNKEFIFPDKVIDEMLASAMKKDSIRARDDEERAKTRPALRQQLKALVARDLWDMSEYYQIMNTDDPVVNRGLAILRERKKGK